MSKEAKLDFGIFRRLMIFVKNYRKLLFLSFFCTIILSLLTPFRPKLIGIMVDKYIISGQNEKELFHWTALILLVLLFEGIFQFLNAFSSNLLAISKQSITVLLNEIISKSVPCFNMAALPKGIKSSAPSTSSLFWYNSLCSIIYQ
jgi:ABC-type multidrug transport system fused ATPase/permease subunit